MTLFFERLTIFLIYPQRHNEQNLCFPYRLKKKSASIGGLWLFLAIFFPIQILLVAKSFQSFWSRFLTNDCKVVQ